MLAERGVGQRQVEETGQIVEIHRLGYRRIGLGRVIAFDAAFWAFANAKPVRFGSAAKRYQYRARARMALSTGSLRSPSFPIDPTKRRPA